MESELLAARCQTELSNLMLESLKKNKIIAESSGMRKPFTLAVRAVQTDTCYSDSGRIGIVQKLVGPGHLKRTQMTASLQWVYAAW